MSLKRKKIEEESFLIQAGKKNIMKMNKDVVFFSLVVLNCVTLFLFVDSGHSYNDLVDKYNDLLLDRNKLVVESFVFEQKYLFTLSELNNTMNILDNPDRVTNYCDKGNVFVTNVLPTGSMKPFIYSGYVTVEKIDEGSNLFVGDVVAFENPRCENNSCNLILHAITSIDFSERVVLTKGYNNMFEDNFLVPFDNIKYRYCTLLPSEVNR